MKSLAFLVLVACATEHGASPPPPVCGDQTCAPGQLCETITAGLTCDTNPDAGIGSFDVLSQRCVDPPASCGDVPSCECIAGCALPNGEGRPCLDVFDQQVSCGCF